MAHDHLSLRSSQLPLQLCSICYQALLPGWEGKQFEQILGCFKEREASPSFCFSLCFCCWEHKLWGCSCILACVDEGNSPGMTRHHGEELSGAAMPALDYASREQERDAHFRLSHSRWALSYCLTKTIVLEGTFTCGSLGSGCSKNHSFLKVSPPSMRWQPSSETSYSLLLALL